MNDCGKAIDDGMGAVPVPPFDFLAIERKARTVAAKPSRRKALGMALLLFSAPLVAAAIAIFVPLEVAHRYGMWQLNGGTEKSFEQPSPAQFHELSREARYRVVWPAIPAGNKALFLGSVSSEVFFIAYPCPGSSYRDMTAVTIIPKNTSGINPQLSKWFGDQSRTHKYNLVFNLGDEVVQMGSDCLSQSQLEQIRANTVQLK